MSHRRAKTPAVEKRDDVAKDANINSRVPDELKQYLKRWGERAPGGMSEAAVIRLAAEIFRDLTLTLGSEWWPEFVSRAGGSKGSLGEFGADAIKGHLEALRKPKK